ncbi:MAG: Ig-like domain-containing protein [Mobilitalea sp.]
MNTKKRLLSWLLLVSMVLSSLWFTPHAVNTVQAEEEEAAGWYMTDYKLVINTKKVDGTFMQGGSYSDIIKIFDIEGTEMSGLESDFENDIRLRYGRYNEINEFMHGYEQTISWDSPEDYYAGGTKIALTNVSNIEVSHTTWTSRPISARFNIKTKNDIYSNRFLTDAGSDQYAIGSEDISITTESPIPGALRGDVAYLIINLNYSSSADAQAIYTYTWKETDNALKAKSYSLDVKKTGWYLSGYAFECTSNPSYDSGGSMTDTWSIYDANGDRAEDCTFLENHVYVDHERYIGANKIENLAVGVRYEIKWDSPANFLASGSKITIKNYSNKVILSQIWGTSYIHPYAETTGFKTEISNTAGNSWPEAADSITLTANAALPEGTAGQTLKVYIQISSGVGTGVYTYSWETKAEAPTVTKSGVTLYRAGSNKQLTYQIALKNKAGYTVSYKSRKSSVATVSKKGVITAKKAGKANVIVSFKKDGKTYTKIVKVVVKNK